MVSIKLNYKSPAYLLCYKVFNIRDLISERVNNFISSYRKLNLKMSRHGNVLLLKKPEKPIWTCVYFRIHYQIS